MNWTLLGLWFDLTCDEVNKTGIATDGLVQRLGPASTYMRGQTKNQTPLYPPSLAKDGIEALKTLVLHDIDYTPRAIILDFKSLRLKLSYLTHTSVQVLRRDQWNLSFKAVHKKHRGKVALALEFSDYFIVFISNDLVFQPIWESPDDPALRPSPVLYDDYPAFLEIVAKWIENRVASKASCMGLACEEMRAEQSVWCGVGVYTVCELFFDAGISPFLTEAEVFDCPSRTARLCEAFYSYAYYSRENLLPLLKAATVDGILAPTKDQRLKYVYWLHVYAKNTTSIPARMSTLVDDYHLALNQLENVGGIWSREIASSLFDAFEPLYIQNAFITKELNLGHLIFGDSTWKMLDGPVSSKIDPLSSLYRKQGLYGSSTYLKVDHYKTLYPPPDSTHKHQKTYLYQGKKQIWSILRCFSENSVPCLNAKRSKRKPLVEYTGLQREQCLFTEIVKSPGNSVAIGPLEYCGNGVILRQPSGKKQLSITHDADPQLTVDQITRKAKSEFRTKFKLDAPGKAKVGMTNLQRKAQTKYVTKALREHEISTKNATSSVLPCPGPLLIPSPSHYSTNLELQLSSLPNRPTVKKKMYQSGQTTGTFHSVLFI